ncbi:hypothetical protein ES703_13152 [subsurface metagenome]
MGKIVEVITARGHPRVTARHPTTLMITKDEEVGPKGDCIIAVAASRGAAEFSDDFKKAIKSGAAVTITIESGGSVEKVRAFGHPSLTLEHPTDLVVRKSEFICGRTLAIRADKAAAGLSRSFVSKLQSLMSVRVVIEVALS